MRYNITEGPNAGKRINIPENVIEQGLREGLDRKATIERYLSDEGLLVNPLVAEYTEAAKVAGTTVKNVGEKTERKAPVRKPDDIKRGMIAALEDFLATREGVEDVAITNVERMIAFAYAGDKYELTLTKKRKPKE